MEMFWAAPPVTRTIAAAMLGSSILIWRLVSSFLITGPQLDIILDPFFLYRYGSSLERDSTRFQSPGDFLVYVVFVAVVIILTNAIYFGGFIFTKALILAVAYTYTQENRGQKATIYVLTFPIKWLPLVMLLITFVMGGPRSTMVQVTGLLAAHLYEFLTRIYPTYGGGRNYIQTPNFVRRWFATRTNTRSYGTAYAARSGGADAGRGSSTGFSSGGGLSALWNSRGSGRRLGGD
ncbi:MAG: hypothetical protein M1823_000435 [Watsoniomyces obsoletus]|nr:MAG: hypothetical protein M1823_000435 [Watsoniomyces obsoletus]